MSSPVCGDGTGTVVVVTTATPDPRDEVRSLRFRKGGVAAVQAVADRDGISWTEAARRLLGYAVWKMPEGWHPGRIPKP